MENFNFQLRKAYKFSLRNISDIESFGLKSTYEKVKVKIDAVDHTDAVKYSDIHTIHENMRLLPELANTYAEDLTFVIFELENKDKVAIAIEWIDTTTIELVEEETVIFTFKSCTVQTRELIKLSLLELGITDYETRLIHN